MDELSAIDALRLGLQECMHHRRLDFGYFPVPEQAKTIAATCDFAAHNRMPPEEPLSIWAYRAVNAAISDLSCTGSREVHVQTDIRVPRTATHLEVQEVGKGIRVALKASGASLTNGCNLTLEDGTEFMMTTSAQAPSCRSAFPGRDHAKANDALVLIGNAGAFNVALHSVACNSRIVSDKTLLALLGGKPKLELGSELVSRNIISSIIDCNDCVATSVLELLKCNRLHLSELDGITKMPQLELGVPSGSLSLLATCPDENLAELVKLAEKHDEEITILGHLGTIRNTRIETVLQELSDGRWHPPVTWKYPTDEMLQLFEDYARTL